MKVVIMGCGRLGAQLAGLLDAAGQSAILEFANGTWQNITDTRTWQVLTNSPVYDVPLSERKNTCWRYRTVWDRLEQVLGTVGWQSGMNILQSVAVPPNTQWSAVYDVNSKTIHLSLYSQFESVSHIHFYEIQ